MKRLFFLSALLFSTQSFPQSQLLKVGSAEQFSNETIEYWLVLTTGIVNINGKEYFIRQINSPWSDQVSYSNIFYERIEGDSLYYVLNSGNEDSLVFNFNWGAGKIILRDTSGNNIIEERIDSISNGTIYVPQDTIYYISNYSIDISTGDTSYWIPPYYEYTKKLGRIGQGIFVFMSGAKIDGVRYGYVLPYPEEITFSADSIYVQAEGDSGSIYIVNNSDYYVSLDSIRTNSIYGYNGKFSIRGKEHFFYLVGYYPNQYSDTLTINISAHDSIIVSFFDVDLCPICVNSVETFFQDTLQFEFSFHELYNYNFSKLIDISGQGHLSAVEAEEELLLSFKLLQNYPNPFNPSTKIKYIIPTFPQSPPSQGGKAKQGWFTVLKVYDVLGNEVATLVNEDKQAGSYEVTFDASQLSSGIYFYTLKAGTFIETKKLILMK